MRQDFGAAYRKRLATGLSRDLESSFRGSCTRCRVQRMRTSDLWVFNLTLTDFRTGGHTGSSSAVASRLNDGIPARRFCSEGITHLHTILACVSCSVLPCCGWCPILGAGCCSFMSHEKPRKPMGLLSRLCALSMSFPMFLMSLSSSMSFNELSTNQ